MTGINFIWPVTRRPSFPWGRYPSGGYHPAYDLAVPTGTTVVAPASGVAYRVGWDDSGYGWHVRIRHSNGWISILAHNDSFLVSPGQFVRQGQAVSISDSSGRSTGPHVHWETRYNDSGRQRYTAFDPGPYIRGSITDTATGPNGGPTGGPTGTPVGNWVGGQAGSLLLAPAMSLAGDSGEAVSHFTKPVHLAPW